MTYTIRYARATRRQMRRIQPQWRDEIRAACDALAYDPFPRGVKKLSPAHTNEFRIRAPHNFRVTYLIDTRTRTVRIMEIVVRPKAYLDRS